ncbi:MAG: hypothetical protein NTZ19_00950 [Bacteroidetes bacterium]|nr:hypothetical protein [Bacteroidota bacterium]
MNNKILVLYYSQSGQLGTIINNLVEPLKASGNNVEIVLIEPAQKYSFPWTGESFFNVMPDCVLEIPTELKEFQLKEKRYDLIILGYQAWFLSPSIPFNSILNHVSLKNIITNTPVITITGARNMWISAMNVVRRKLKELGAKHVGNIALVDNHANLVSFITIFYWMFTGKQDRYLNIFPKPGVANTDIENCKVFGCLIEKFLEAGNFDGMQEALVEQKAVAVKYNLMFIESKAKRIFSIWANIIIKKRNQKPWLIAFKYYLIIALFVAAPIILTIDALFFKPFLKNRIDKQKKYILGVNEF